MPSVKLTTTFRLKKPKVPKTIKPVKPSQPSQPSQPADWTDYHASVAYHDSQSNRTPETTELSWQRFWAVDDPPTTLTNLMDLPHGRGITTTGGGSIHIIVNNRLFK